ncbi:MAG: HAMP domain-containing histidine kinase [Gomphosphaeria aponina SAG 52.96 = DSM 107014]|uniref:histidine kinase n=1 Tax=Gomphosphaeria aponina SAG 52.96 = DSM 107014 TaxID=1521640 RepID=A0A941GP91_9CHRO|nr:HAMP domain-containing histidine kinase [Gomphosphaeria aponina SAG 52.96 = DSM 107014]
MYFMLIKKLRRHRHLLDLARADSGSIHFYLEPIILNELVTEIGGMAQQYNNRTINIETGAEKVIIKADINRLKQVLLNLIDNGVKYSEKEITIKVEKIKETAIIQVSDRGSGIPLAQQNRIFERFYRLDEAKCRNTGGTGLGLSIVKTLVEGMGGKISLRSQLGEGSSFIISFPVYCENLLC